MYAPTRESTLRTGARLALAAGRALQSLAATAGARVEARAERSLSPTIGERDVSVLFADLRGYSRYAESHCPADVFRLLESYAEHASAVVESHGGRVLSFHGDGLLAVFDGPGKERAAYQSALALVRAVYDHGELPCRPAPEELPIGIGIATGRAFLGRIGSGPGATWSATGDPTNVAARLQAMSRTLGSPILMDRPTFVHVATPCTPHPRVPIRGREATVDVFTPLGASQLRGCDEPAPVGGLRGVGASLRRAPAGATG